MTNSSIEARRQAALVGAEAASALHKKLDIPGRISKHSPNVDVYSIIEELGILLMFKDLDGPLGLCIRQPVPGILINRGRPHMMQRFTAAHELAHLMLNHGGSIDHRVFQIVGDSFNTDRELDEVAADAFASEFLFPKWLIQRQTRTYGWATKLALTDASTVYQLSLRIGGSFEATLWALNSLKVFNFKEFQQIRNSTPKEHKDFVLGGHKLPHPLNDVWQLGLHDIGQTYSLRQGDFVSVELPSLTTSGYVWNFAEQLPNHLVTVEEDKHLLNTGKRLGDPAIRRILLSVKQSGTFSLSLNEEREWHPNAKARATFQSTFKIFNPEIGGLPNAARQRQRVAS